MATTFIWKGRSPNGEILSGEYAAENKDDLIGYLRKRKIIITSVKQKSKEFNITMPWEKRVSVKDLGVFTRQFATMINAGLPMVQCLDILTSQMEKPYFRQAVSTVMSDVEGGSTLGEAMGRHPSIFSRLFVNMVEAGEAGGILDLILNRLAVYLEKADQLQRKVKSAMTYPAVVCFVALGATTFMLMFIIPTFARMFSDFGGELPTPTRIVMGFSDFLRNYWYFILGGVIASIVVIKRFYATEVGKTKIDGFLLRLPALGIVIRKGAVA
ncbi:MAG: type II secretion system F family protein, partial [Candidatus Krumholzibacteria bacterium]|nr:type II secretion system F family protein [Candidatus Krumholzibacteria bacterium]